MSKNLGLGSRPSCEAVAAALPEGAAAIAEATVIVTGSNIGIGEEAAFHFANLGANVVLACRNSKKADAAKARMVKRAKGKTLRVETLPLDLGDFASIQAFADTFKAQSEAGGWPPLQVLVLNAGMFSARANKSAQGFEQVFAVNHLGGQLLTNLMLPALRANAPSRVVVVASASHFGPYVTKDILNKDAVRALALPATDSKGLSDGGNRYGSSKLANVLHAMKLHERESANGVAACSLHPGNLILTNISAGTGTWAPIRFLHKWVVSWFTKSLNQGAATTVFCALAPHDELQGGYFDSAHSEAQSKRATLEAATVQWDVCEELINSKL